MFQIVVCQFKVRIFDICQFHKLLVFCKTNDGLKNYFCFQDNVPEILTSIYVQNFTYGSCTSYIGKICRHESKSLRTSRNSLITQKNSQLYKETTLCWTGAYFSDGFSFCFREYCVH